MERSHFTLHVLPNSIHFREEGLNRSHSMKSRQKWRCWGRNNSSYSDCLDWNVSLQAYPIVLVLPISFSAEIHKCSVRITTVWKVHLWTNDFDGDHYSGTFQKTNAAKRNQRKCFCKGTAHLCRSTTKGKLILFTRGKWICWFRNKDMFLFKQSANPLF